MWLNGPRFEEMVSYNVYSKSFFLHVKGKSNNID